MTRRIAPRLLLPALALGLVAATVGPVTAAAESTEAAAGSPAAPAVTPSSTSLVPEGGVVAYSLVAPTSVAASGLVARAIVPAGTPCPSLSATVGGTTSSVAMSVRSAGASTGNAFSAVRVCSAAIPKGASAATILGTAIPAAMPRSADSIAYLADTGCRIKLTVQDCLDADAWPLEKNADLIAQGSADLIIHGGDYIYREAPCPVNDADRCGGSPDPTTGLPFLDNAALWFADFFDPAAAMLTAAPIVAVRGNHEACDTAGNGYFLFMDPRPNTARACAPKGGSAPVYQSASWATNISLAGGRSTRLVVVDSTNGWDSTISPFMPTQRKSYRQAAKLAKGAKDAWLVVHRPVLGITSTQYAPTGDHLWVPWSAADQAAGASGLLKRYSLIISGHEHLSQAVQVPQQPPQFVAGAGATSLNPKTGYAIPQYGALTYADGTPMSSSIKPYPKASSLWNDVTFAIVLATPGSTAGSWSMAYTAPNGSTVQTCSVAKRAVTCPAA